MTRNVTMAVGGGLEKLDFDQAMQLINLILDKYKKTFVAIHHAHLDAVGECLKFLLRHTGISMSASNVEKLIYKMISSGIDLPRKQQHQHGSFHGPSGSR